jgi:hypothetical protein
MVGNILIITELDRFQVSNLAKIKEKLIILNVITQLPMQKLCNDCIYVLQKLQHLVIGIACDFIGGGI